MDFNRRSVCGASTERCGIATRLAVVRWTCPSAVSAEGETVAAFAVHIGEALIRFATSDGLAFQALS